MFLVEERAEERKRCQGLLYVAALGFGLSGDLEGWGPHSQFHLDGRMFVLVLEELHQLQDYEVG